MTRTTRTTRTGRETMVYELYDLYQSWNNGLWVVQLVNCISLEGLLGSHALRTQNIRQNCSSSACKYLCSSPIVPLVNHCFTTGTGRTSRVKPFTGRICSTVLDKDFQTRTATVFFHDIMSPYMKHLLPSYYGCLHTNLCFQFCKMNIHWLKCVLVSCRGFGVLFIFFIVRGWRKSEGIYSKHIMDIQIRSSWSRNI